MEGVWQQTRSPDASSSAMFIHSHERAHTYTNTHQYSFVSVVQSSGTIPTSCCPIISEPALCERRGNSGTSSISRHPSRPKAGVQDGGWTALANAHPQRGRMGRQIERRWRLCSKNSPPWIASLPHIFVSVCSASCGCVSAHFTCVVWCPCRQLAWKSFPRVTG